MVEAPFLRKLAIGVAVLVRPVVSPNSLWYAMLGEDWPVHCPMGIFRTMGNLVVVRDY